MPVRIVRPVKTPAVEMGYVTCNNCSSGLEFEREDVRTHRGFPYIMCPACGKYLYHQDVPFSYTKVEPTQPPVSKKDEVVKCLRNFGLSSVNDTCYFEVDDKGSTFDLIVRIGDDFIGSFSASETLYADEDLNYVKISTTLERLNDKALSEYEEKRAQMTEPTIKQFELDMNEVYKRLNASGV